MVKLQFDEEKFGSSSPFNHLVIDNFLEDLDFAKKLESEFFDYDAAEWHVYSNEIEEKKTCNSWNLFNPHIYRYFQFVNSPEFVNKISRLVGADLFADPGLHGGGMHIHKSGGNLNPHLDYSIHPKAGLQRRLNLIVYLSSDVGLQTSGDGCLGLWEGSSSAPKNLIHEIAPVFNRAVIFDTTQNSWHGMSTPLSDHADYCRRSLASYYLQKPDDSCDSRSRALFAPRESQKDDSLIKDLCEKRSSEDSVAQTYITKK
jgi:Rps23 Pro-64 3,4-dihydroxylase Tpa1-like proline 4-hydroxylase